MPEFQKSIEENDKINSSLKPIVHECFETMYQTLGKYDFLRWISQRKVDEKVKTLIVDIMTEEDHKRSPNAAGIYEFSKNRIGIGKNYTRSKGVVSHELDHFLSNSPFCTYLDEGITEYIKSLALPVREDTPISENHNTYVENVRTVKWLHKMMGDTIIKAYFVGDRSGFDKQFKELTGCSQAELIEFYSALDRRHETLHGKKEDEIKLEESKKDTKTVVDMLSKVVIGKMREHVTNYDFYDKDGKLNIDLINKTFQDIITTFPFSLTDEQLKFIRDGMLGIIADETHLLADSQGKEKEERRAEFIVTAKTKSLGDNGKEVFSKIFQKAFEGKEGLNFTEFADIASKILEHFNISERERNALISEYAIKVLGKDIDIKFVDQYVKANVEKNKNLRKITQDRKRDTIESHFVRIGDEDSNTFIEKRDNKYYVIKVKENGEIVEIGLPVQGREFARDEEHPGHNLLEVSSNGKDEYTVEGTRFKLGEKLEDIEIITQKRKKADLGVMSLEEFIHYQRTLPLLKEIMNDKYYDILEDGQDPTYGVKGIVFAGPGEVDPRSRALQVDRIKEQLAKVDIICPDKKRAMALKRDIINSIIGRTYGIAPTDEKTKAAYDMISEVILEDLPEDERKSKLSNGMGILNAQRREKVEENLKRTGIQFKSEEVRKTYSDRVHKAEEAQEKEKRYQEIVERNRKKEAERRKFEADKKRVRHSAYYRIIEDEEYAREGIYADSTRGFGLSGTGIIGGSLDAPGKREILVEDFTRDVLSVTSRMTDPEEAQKFVIDCARTTITAAYQRKRDEITDPRLQEQFDFMIQSLVDRVLSGKEIDEERFEQANTELNEERQKGSKKGAIFFRDSKAEKTYSDLLELQETLPESTFKKVAKAVVEAYNPNRGDETRDDPK